MSDPLSKPRLSEFTRAEFLEFVVLLANAEGLTEEEDDRRVDHFARLVEPHPQGTDLLFWPEPGADDSPPGVVAEIERFFHARGLRCFRDG